MSEDNLDPTQLGPEQPDLPGGGAPDVMQIGRYKVLGVLGRGSFGTVYLAVDEELERRVAVKVPHNEVLSDPADAEIYLAEARTLARLDHPSIVPVYDVGRCEECACFIVSKYIKGTSLAELLAERTPGYREAVPILISLAEALQHAHRMGFVHRDVKPANILIDTAGNAFLVDFGLAVRDDEPLSTGYHGGTAAYMSPEQARGEGHRIDGRSDIFSLGIVMYRMLTGRHPFRSKSSDDVLKKIILNEIRPLRQYDENLPRELERICAKATAKRANERYLSAHDLAEDLKLLQQDLLTLPVESPSTSPPDPDAEAFVGQGSAGSSAPTSESRSRSRSAIANVVPRGLRSFDGHDAEFFLQLLPGARDREGWPDVIRFWKARIEEPELQDACPVGLIYGPSGCGKSSLVKAGILPRLSRNVRVVYVEATPHDTETRILNGLQSNVDVPARLDLVQCLASLRRGGGLGPGEKVLIVLDQFEQWLHGASDLQESSLVNALRHCDGHRVQCLITLRDDFWMAITRFLVELEVELVQGRNLAAVDLFPVRHAEKVLTAFGVAYGELPETGELSSAQRDFVRQSVNGLANDGSVVCVRLALFAEMMKNRSWTPDTLKQLGGTSGVGVKFLDETFSSPSSNPRHRLHQKAARAVLSCLLPDRGSEIKGHMRSRAELLEASGYSSRPRDFEELISILDRGVRLITPTDPAGLAAEDDSFRVGDDDQVYYQLTHDYLVHSLREWLTRKQKETRRGRAELALLDRTLAWKARPENRLLPSLWEYANLRLYTSPAGWSGSQQAMMRRAVRFHGRRLLVVAGLFLLAVLIGRSIGRSVRSGSDKREARLIVDGLMLAKPQAVADYIPRVRQHAEYTTRMLSEIVRDPDVPPVARLHAALALMPGDDCLPILRAQLLTGFREYFPIITESLQKHAGTVSEGLWEIASAESKEPPLRFRAACALAEFTPGDERWDDIADFTANRLARVLPSELPLWRNALEPVSRSLLPGLRRHFADHSERESVRLQATDLLAHYLAEDASELFSLLQDANVVQFEAVVTRLDPHTQTLLPLAMKALSGEISADSDADYQLWASARANVAVWLMRTGHAKHVWPLFRRRPNNLVRSYLVDRAGRLHVPVRTIIDRLLPEPDKSAKAALLLTLGGFDPALVRGGDISDLKSEVRRICQTEDDAALHSAAKWLMTQWPELELVEPGGGEPPQRRGLEDALSAGGVSWFTNSQGQKMVVLHAGVFAMGAPESEERRQPSETLHQRSIGRRFAIATTEVTKAQYDAFLKENPGVFRPRSEDFVKTLDSPQTGMTWYEMVAYCNWLSEVEGLEPCYVPAAGGYVAGMKPGKDYLRRNGYRLPSEAEWEFACRSDTTTSRHYGSDSALLSGYAWYLTNADGVTRPVAHKRPNDFGLFDMLGNAAEACHERMNGYKLSAEPTPDVVDVAEVSDDADRPVRGGGAGFVRQYIRSASRNSWRPITNRDYTLGLRLVRTIPH